MNATELGGTHTTSAVIASAISGGIVVTVSLCALVFVIRRFSDRVIQKPAEQRRLEASNFLNPLWDILKSRFS
jgi:hypothetical protein